MTIDKDDYEVIISDRIADNVIARQLSIYSGRKIILPYNHDRWPDKQFLEYHNDVIFKG